MVMSSKELKDLSEKIRTILILIDQLRFSIALSSTTEEKKTENNEIIKRILGSLKQLSDSSYSEDVKSIISQIEDKKYDKAREALLELSYNILKKAG